VSFSYSAVIPAYNAEKTIGQAIDSILGQTIPPQEIIVVDDGSTDATAALVAGLAGPITVISQNNRGPGAATTAGLGRVTTAFVATLDSDDVWLPEKTARQAACFDDDPGLSGVFTLARLFADGAPPDPSGPGAVRRLWTRTTLMFRTEAAREVGDLVDQPGRLGEVIDWLARSRDLGQRHVMVEEILALRRIRPGSLSYGRDPERNRGYLAVVRDALERKRRLATKPGTDPTSE
jgi:glycosyltransferase involved in cell wall biosynthesis